MSRVLTPAAPLPGFPEATTLNLEPVEGALGLYAISSTQAPQLHWYVLDASVHIPKYSPRFTAEQLGLLDNPGQDSRSLLVVVNTSDDQVSVNLLAPLLLDTRSGACAQLILEGQDWPLRHELNL